MFIFNLDFHKIRIQFRTFLRHLMILRFSGGRQTKQFLEQKREIIKYLRRVHSCFEKSSPLVVINLKNWKKYRRVNIYSCCIQLQFVKSAYKDFSREAETHLPGQISMQVGIRLENNNYWYHLSCNRSVLQDQLFINHQ